MTLARLALLTWVLWHLAPWACVAARPSPVPPLFPEGNPVRVEFEVPPEGIAGLRTKPRQDVFAVVRSGGVSFTNVALHLKGARGSSRPIDDKPSFTLDFSAVPGGLRFHGVRKIHFNNSVEDPTFLNEQIGSELFRAADLPAPRVGHALVSLNGKSLGLFVVKEGFAEEFLAQFFRVPTGTLYEPGPGHDVDQRLQRRLGEGPEDQADLKAVAEAAMDPDLPRRARALARVLDLDRFLSFMTLEILIGHRDGYCLARNNFRLYADPDSGRFVFLPQGMDQLFGNPSAVWRPEMSGLVARSFLELPDGRSRYRERFTRHLTLLLDPLQISNRVDRLAAKIRPVLSQPALPAFEAEVAQLQKRIAQRRRDLEAQLAVPELAPLVFREGRATPEGPWKPVDVPEGGRLDVVQLPDSRCLHIVAGPRTAASWRCRILLPAGHYEFQARVRTAGVVPLAFGRRQGAAIRLAEIADAVSSTLLGDQPWQVLRAPFQVSGSGGEQELICELRASRGEVWFDMNSLTVVISGR